MKKELYNLLYEWLIEENCDYCQHLESFRDGDMKHPCNRCECYERFKLADRMHDDLKDKMKEIIKVVK